MDRHISTEHGSKKMVLSLVEEMLSGVVSTKCSEFNVNEMVSSVVDEIIASVVEDSMEAEISPYLRMRNERVALIHAEFRKKFPCFENEVRELRVERKGKSRKMKSKAIGIVARRSSRFDQTRNQIGISSSGEGMLVVVPANGGTDGSQEEMGNVGDERVQDDGAVVDHGVGGGEEVAGAGGDEGWQEETGGLQVGDLGKHGCPPCGLKFRDSYNLKRHVQFVHGARQEPISCPRPWCEERFDVLAEMKEHLVTCLMVCPTCMKTFVRSDKYAAHQRAHVRLARRMKD